MMGPNWDPINCHIVILWVPNPNITGAQVGPDGSPGPRGARSIDAVVVDLT